MQLSKKQLPNTVILVLVLVFAASGYAETQTIDQRVSSLLKEMTLEEKVGQMNQYNGFWDATGPAPDGGDAKIKYEHLQQGRVGSVLNVYGSERVRELQKINIEKSRLKIPLIFGSDVIHGHKTLFPIPLAEAASWDLEAIEKSARIAAIEASAQGINWTFAPMVDISKDARWGRVAEGAGEDPFLGSAIAKARIHGFQGNDLAQPDTIAACAKHFAGYGFVEAGRDYNSVDMSMYTFYNTVLPPFKASLDAGVRTFMNAFNTFNGVPATASSFLQRDILKEQWGFSGFVVSDWGSIGELVSHGYAENPAQAAEQAVRAGSDMDMESLAYVRHLETLVREGVVDEQLIDDAVARILKVKFELGLFDDPYRYVNNPQEKTLLYSAQHMAAARDVAKRSIVLLKNDRNLLPIKKSQKNIAVIGPLANDKNSTLGTWRVSSDDNHGVSLLEGLHAYNGNYTFAGGVKFSMGEETFSAPVRIDASDKSGLSEAVELAKKSELVIMMLGEHGYQSGEARSRSELGFPGLQQELLEAVYAVNKNIVLVVASGRPLILTWAAEHIPSILQTWQLGSQSGHAIADVIFGQYNPSGKLPMSFPRSIGQIPISYQRFSTGRPNASTTVFWSHYNDEKNEPLYPFGFGLSYTQFEYSELTINAKNKASIKVSLVVKNVGKVAGEEVVQLYIRDKVASLVRPTRELKAFKKIHLRAGKKQKLTFELTPQELGFYNQKGNFIVESGEFDIFVGGSSDAALLASFTL